MGAGASLINRNIKEEGVRCPKCKGKGVISTSSYGAVTCPNCEGKGFLQDTSEEEKASAKGKSPAKRSGEGRKKEGETFISGIAKKLGLLREKASVIVVGLDNSGKTTLLNFLKPETRGAVNEVTPTIGFTLERFRRGKLDFTCFDMSGQSKYRSLWETYYKNCDAIIWVVDSADPLRMCVVKDEFRMMLSHKDIEGRHSPILFFSNKMDIEAAMAPEAVVDELELPRIRDREWHVSACNAISGKGVDEGLSWLMRAIAQTRE
eukprot:g2417.t1